MHAVDEEDEDTVDGDEDVPRRSFTALGRFRPTQTNLQEGIDENGVQQGENKRTATAIDGQRRICDSHRR